ncbi:MAG: hypothetical protein A2126_00430 [Candidatus Woykebacteria bacterium GWB1_45_5]|uniref:Uncharacterized protein n=2 Tax=Candidatus Woykeibacteriota TaxID=1817899 RepID=A0A1G1W3A4_9BACT|nr:MAG: hypothetical protein A2113_02820 [Candidatus Woykebacteria bacterium GWA1_44_8]OGY22637.1 MAG: hypothetical protein A2126_00430 [Candidatus Woykebacteria bacterium GWB1_45_5]
MKKLFLASFVLIILVILAWSPWITKEVAKDKVAKHLTIVDKFGDTASYCYFSDFAGGVAKKVPFGVLVSGTVNCPPLLVVPNEVTFFVSPLATVHKIKSKSVTAYPSLVKFRLIDGEKNKPAASWQIRICDNSVTPQPCLEDKLALAVVKTDKDGIFYFNPDDASKYGFVINPGNHYQYVNINVGRKDSVAANYKPDNVYVMETDKTGNVLRWKEYSLKTKLVTISERNEESITQNFDTIDVTVFYNPYETKGWK